MSTFVPSVIWKLLLRQHRCLPEDPPPGSATGKKECLFCMWASLRTFLCHFTSFLSDFSCSCILFLHLTNDSCITVVRNDYRHHQTSSAKSPRKLFPSCCIFSNRIKNMLGSFESSYWAVCWWSSLSAQWVHTRLWIILITSVDTYFVNVTP